MSLFEKLEILAKANPTVEIPHEKFKNTNAPFFNTYTDRSHHDLETNHSAKHLTDNEKLAVRHYVQSCKVNKHLREGLVPKSKEDLKDHYTKYRDNSIDFEKNPNGLNLHEANDSMHARIHHIDAAINKNKAHRDIIAFRGVDEATANKLQLGNVVKKRGYTSTSISAKTAGSFGDGHIMHVRIPKGHPMHYVPTSFRPAMHEQEVLLPRNSHMRIDRKETANGRHIIYATALHPHEYDKHDVEANG